MTDEISTVTRSDVVSEICHSRVLFEKSVFSQLSVSKFLDYDDLFVISA